MRLSDSLGRIVAFTILLFNFPTTSAIPLDISSPASIKAAAKDVAEGIILWYTGGVPGQVASNIPGLLPAPYYWWEAGAMCGVLMDYWYYTGDTSYNNIVTEAMMFQVGPEADFMTQNATNQEGNDDQAFWGMAAMTAAEYKFPNPPADKPQWLALAQGVWNSQQLRWDTSYCGGGLEWQIFEFNPGWGYKNTPANAGFMNLGSRLYAYTGNDTYLEWAEKSWTWMYDLGYIGGYKNYTVFDGGGISSNCTLVNPTQWTYNVGMLLNACSVLWNATGDQAWQDRALGIWDAALVFFNPDKILVEAACEPYGTCNGDQLSFKAYFSRFIAASTKWLPALYPAAQPYLEASAIAAAKQCSGSADGLEGDACGLKWTMGSNWDGTYGFGQQFDALEIIQSQLIEESPAPVTLRTGGISHGDASAGTGGDFAPGPPDVTRPITTADKAGAGILTAFIVLTWLAVIWWMV